MIIAQDLRAVFGVARDQGARPTCLAHAITDAHGARMQPYTLLSVEYLYYHGIQRMPNPKVLGGISFSAASAALKNEGQPNESEWPYLKIVPSNLALWLPPKNCSVFRSAVNANGISIKQVIDLLDAQKPIILIIKISESFYMPNEDGVIKTVPYDPDTGKHAVIAVGHGTLRGKSCILVRNSWGPRWGIDGHAWIQDDYLDQRLICVATVEAL